MSLLFTLENLLLTGVYPRDRWWEEGDDDDDDDEGGGGGGGDDDDDDAGGGGGGGDDDDDSGGGDFDPGDSGGDFDFGGDSGDDDDDDQGDDSGGGFDWGDQGSDQGDQGDDSGWVAVQDYEENGRTIRKFTDNTGTDYFQDVGEWPSGSATERSRNGDNGFDWGDTNQRDNWMRGEPDDREMPEVDQDIQDLHDYYHPYTVSKFEDDPVRRGWGDGVATDGTRFDQQDDATRDMFGQAYGDRAAQFWAEQRSRDLEAEFRSRGVVTLPQQQQPQDMAPSAGAQSPLFGLQHPTNPDGTPVQYAVGPDPNAPQPANALGLGAIGEVPAPTSTPYIPPAVSEAPPTPPAEEAVPPPQPAAPPSPPVAPPAGQQAAADAAARATAAAGGSPQQVADAAAAAALAYDRRNLSSESPATQREFEQAFGSQANERWVQQHNQELALNRALYGTDEPSAGSRPIRRLAIPGLGPTDVGPAPDRTIGRAEPAPWNRPATPTTTSPGAVGVRPSTVAEPSPSGPAASYTPPATQGVPSVIGDTGAPPVMASPGLNVPPPPTTGALTAARNPNVAQPGDSIMPPAINAATGEPTGLAPLPVNGRFVPPNPNTGVVRGATVAPAPLTAAQAAAYEREGINPATGDIDVQDTSASSAYLPGASPIPSDMGQATSLERPEDILTIRNGNGEIRQEPRWAWDQRGELAQQVWEVVNAEGAPTQTMAEAGFVPTSNVIDTSIRTAANVPVAPPAESPDDLITIRDDVQGTTRVVPRSQLDSWMRPVAPGVPNPWRVVDARPAAGAAPPPPVAPPPPPAGPSIDASVRAAAGVPVPLDPDLGPREGGRVDPALSMNSDPFGFVTSVAAQQQGDTNVEAFGQNVANGISAGESWAEPYTADLARLAWYRETRGLEGDPTRAPDSYVRDWMGAFRAGNTNVAGVQEMSQALVDRGVAPPSNDPFGVVASQAARDQGATDLAGFKRAVAGGIASGEAWTKPYTDQLARMAWYKESGGREGGPENAPQSYINDWTSALRDADNTTPGVAQVNQQLINMGARVTPSNPNQSFDWHNVYGPTGEGLGPNGPSLISRQVTPADCGPNAFANIMRAGGYNAFPKDAFTFAQEGGYWKNGMFQGPEAYANMLRNELGLKATVERIDWAKVDQELAQGRLVTLSSPGETGHYWTIASKNDKGQYYTGATGEVVGHDAWVRPNQITYKNNPPTVMITYSGTIDPKSRAVMSPTLKVTPPPTQQAAPTMVSAPATTRRMQSGETTETSARPATQIVNDARVTEAAQEDVWSSNQPARHALMQEFQQRPKEERQIIFDDAIEQGLDAEGITDPDERRRWKTAMYEITTGTGRLAGTPAEDPDLNPFMISGEFGGKPQTAQVSSATGYFQLIQSNPNGSDYAFMGYIPREYQSNPYHPVGQVRQLIRATKASTFRGDPDALVENKRRNKHYNIVVQRREPY